MIESINNRIKQIQKDSNLSVSKFAETIGIAQPTAKAIIDGDNAPSYKAINGILIGFPNISAEWLLRGEGEMYVSNKPQQTTSIGEAYYKKMLQEMEAMKNRLNSLEGKVS